VNVDNVVANYFTIAFTRAIGHDDVSEVAEGSTDLSTWAPATIVGSPVFNGDGTETVTYRFPNPQNSDTQQFLRIRFTKLP
jgi:hypothetical protein